VRGLYAAKPWYTARLRGVVRFSVERQVSPDAFTWLGVGAAAGAAVAIWHGWWLATAVLLALRLAGANLDGAVARARGGARPWGFVLNEIGDRASDLLLFAGLAGLAAARIPHSTPLVLIAALAATLPTFAALAATGAGAPRRNGGPIGKTERCVLAVIATACPATLAAVCWVGIVGSVATAALRLAAARREMATS
jgi:CDP-diacylglycerol--glycerol-3-phosphate 3-phosphatidyltransferase